MFADALTVNGPLEGGLLGVFPEGHDYILQNDFSAPMKPFHPGFAEFALAASVAVVPFAIVAESERLVPFKVPRAVQRLSGWPEEVVRGVTQKVRYESVCVSFGKAIDRSTSLDALIRETRSAIEGLVSSPAE